jgi:adenine-specific DNA-methyltransferase
MDKLKMHSPNLTQDNIARLRELFPGCVTEAKGANGTVKMAVDFDQLRQELTESIVEGPQERYHLNWPGKREALLTANAPIAKTLRPCREESVDFDTTKNLFIEGDNLDALKLLQETYLGKVKMIYIDPPYYTGNDFIYEDDFGANANEYFERSMQKDEQGNRLVSNSDSNGRFHSDWLSMIYSRLKIARNLLCDEGVIFISIGDEELFSLKSVCDEIFGESNYRGAISRATGTRMGSGNQKISSEFDYILIYSRTGHFEFNPLPMGEDDLSIYDQEDSKGRYLLRSLRRTGGENRREDRPTMYFPVYAPDGTAVYPLAPEGWESRWVCSKAKYDEMCNDDLIEWKKVKKGKDNRWQVYQKHYIGEALKYASNNWSDIDGNKKATREVNELFDGKKVFDHPKPLSLLTKIIQISTKKSNSDIVLDFFAGSGTTAHSVVNSNHCDGGNRRYILIQLPEELSENNKAQAVAFKFCKDHGLEATVASISKERIRRVIKKMPSKEKDRSGFRCLKIAPSNMADVFYSPDALEKSNLDLFVDNIKPDRTPEDLLFQVMLDWGVDLALHIAQRTIQGKDVFFVDSNALAACFDAQGGVDEAFVKELAKEQPLRVVFRDAGFKDSAVKINVEQIFKLLSPVTEVKYI